MKWIGSVMVLLLLALQYRLWWGQGGARDAALMEADIADQQAVNAALARRNEHLAIEVRELQAGYEGLEEKAREDMDMVKEGETYFLYIPDEPAN